MQTTNPAVAAGDPFLGHSRDDNHPAVPHGCIDGFVYVGHLVIEDDGEEVEVIEAIRCRRCVISEHHNRF